MDHCLRDRRAPVLSHIVDWRGTLAQSGNNPAACSSFGAGLSHHVADQRINPAGLAMTLSGDDVTGVRGASRRLERHLRALCRRYIPQPSLRLRIIRSGRLYESAKLEETCRSLSQCAQQGVNRRWEVTGWRPVDQGLSVGHSSCNPSRQQRRERMQTQERTCVMWIPCDRAKSAF